MLGFVLLLESFDVQTVSEYADMDSNIGVKTAREEEKKELSRATSTARAVRDSLRRFLYTVQMLAAGR